MVERGESPPDLGEYAKGSGVQGEEHSLWGGSDQKGLGEELGMFSPLLLFRPNPPTSCVLVPTPTKPFAYPPESGGRNEGRNRVRWEECW